MDEISTGLDSSTTFQIIKYMRQMVQIMDVTMVISLLQPAPETFDLFDDIILLSEGQIVYQGPRENVLVRLRRQLPGGTEDNTDGALATNERELRLLFKGKHDERKTKSQGLPGTSERDTNHVTACETGSHIS